MDPPRIVTEYYPLGSLFSMLGLARDGDPRVSRSLSWPRCARRVRARLYVGGRACLGTSAWPAGKLAS